MNIVKLCCTVTNLIYTALLYRLNLYPDTRLTPSIFEKMVYCIIFRPGNIRVFMYLGRVCNFRAGTRVPASPRLAQKSKMSIVFSGKNKMETKFVEKLSHI